MVEGGTVYTILFIHALLIHDLETEGFWLDARVLKGRADDVVVLCSCCQFSYNLSLADGLGMTDCRS